MANLHANKYPCTFAASILQVAEPESCLPIFAPLRTFDYAWQIKEVTEEDCPDLSTQFFIFETLLLNVAINLHVH